MLLPLQGAGIPTHGFPGCRFALLRAMRLLPFQGAHILRIVMYINVVAVCFLPFQGASILCPEDNAV